MDFPQFISLTITNRCNLRCKMCGQWSETGYMHQKKNMNDREMDLSQWKNVIDEVSANKIPSLLLRGGETFLYPGVMELIRHIRSKDMFISIDTNGTLLKEFAEELVDLGNIHLTISVDGTEIVHDETRGVKGCFEKIKEGIEYLNEMQNKKNKKIGISLNFTISPYSYESLGEMPDVARSLSVSQICIVPYYYVTSRSGKLYEKELHDDLHCKAYSWSGFNHEESGVNFEKLQAELIKFRNSLKKIVSFPYLDLTDNEYRTWFEDDKTTIRQENCSNIEKLIDIQPNGDANFCVDFPDYVIGNVKESSIKKIWNSEKANLFRDYRRKKQLAVCYRCGAKYMSHLV